MNLGKILFRNWRNKVWNVSFMGLFTVQFYHKPEFFCCIDLSSPCLPEVYLGVVMYCTKYEEVIFFAVAGQLWPPMLATLRGFQSCKVFKIWPHLTLLLTANMFLSVLGRDGVWPMVRPLVRNLEDPPDPVPLTQTSCANHWSTQDTMKRHNLASCSCSICQSLEIRQCSQLRVPLSL